MMDGLGNILYPKVSVFFKLIKDKSRGFSKQIIITSVYLVVKKVFYIRSQWNCVPVYIVRT